MNIPTISNPALAQATRAYENFERHQTPFAAAKLDISLQNMDKRQVDEIVEDNFRNEKDVVLNRSQGYLVLMHDTSLEDAESAVRRLKDRLGRLAVVSRKLKNFHQIHASAYILGANKGAARLQIRYLDLSPQLDVKESAASLEPGVGEYIRWLNIPRMNAAQANQAISIKV